jgi:serine phosphatase RsbU (regulator of sigma subunit)
MDDPTGPLNQLLQAAHLCAPHELPGLVDACAQGLGAEGAVAYLADLQQRALVPFHDRDASDDAPSIALPVNSSVAGRAFQLVQVQRQDSLGEPPNVWVPLMDGSERLGVLGVTLKDSTSVDDELLTRFKRLASLTAELVVAKTLYGDTIVRLRRQQDMGLAAEIQWNLLPPLTFASSDVTVAAALEPAYVVAGDSIDYAVDYGRARVAMFDAMGHGLRSAQLGSLAVGAYRNGRRSGHSNADIAKSMDDVLASAFGGESFVTAILADLDTDTGRLEWVNAGHPEPLLLRHGRLVRHLHADPVPPLGLGFTGQQAAIATGSERLQPGDRVLFYTDGAVEARSPQGNFFGVHRLADLILRHIADGMPAPETMRRTIQALLAYHDEQLDDDSSLLLLEWKVGNQQALLP